MYGCDLAKSKVVGWTQLLQTLPENSLPEGTSPSRQKLHP